MISLVKGRHEIIKQSFRPAVSMRLEDCNNASIPTGTGGGQCGLDFHRVMTVIIDDHDVVRFTLDLETPANAAKILEPFGYRRKGHIEFHANGYRGQGIQDVVTAGHADAQITELFTAEQYFKSGTIAAVLDLSGLEIRLAAHAVSHEAFSYVRDHPLQVLVIQTENDQAVKRHLVDEINECRADFIKVIVIVEMICIDIRNHRDSRRELQERAV